MKDLIGQGYKIIAGATSSGVALQEAPLAAQNHVLFISGPAANDGDHRAQQVHVPLRPPDLPGRRRRRDVPAPAPARTSSSSPRTRRSGRATTLAVKAIMGGKNNVTPIYVPLTATDFTPFAQQVKNANPDLRLRRVGRHDRDADVAGARPAERLPGRQDDRDRPRRAGDLPALRPGGREDPVHLALRLPGAEQQGERLAQGADAQEEPVPRPVHAGRVRGRADDRARAAGRRRERGQDGLGARGVEVPRPEGLAGHPAAGSRDAAADVPGLARQDQASVWTAKVLGTASSYQTAPPITTVLQ